MSSQAMDSRRVLCKFFARGACRKGEHCEFSHDWKDQPNNICIFYQKGVCSYGSRCRYDHIEVSQHQTSGPSSLNSRSSVALSASQVNHSFVPLDGDFKSVLSSSSCSSQPAISIVKPARTQNCDNVAPDNDVGPLPTSIRLADRSICAFAASGSCPNGDECPHIHGDLCSICGKYCLHPYRPDEREEHLELCQKNKKHLEALKLSEDIECSVCLDRVLSKPTAAERKFGLLPECDHPFCISCIRNWRSNSPASGMDLNTALRACPVCRKRSYFVIPSVVWYSTKAEKQEIIDSYKAKLKSIDCKYFDFGNGRCPFGNSCFYKHMYKQGSNRSRTFQPPRYKPPGLRSHAYGYNSFRLEDALIDEEELLEELARELSADEELEDLEGVEVDSLLAFLLRRTGLNALESSSDDES